MSKIDEFAIKAKVLFYGNFMVDESLLNKGLYETKRPTLHSLASTIEEKVEIAKMLIDKAGQSLIPESYLENLNKCEFREVVICADFRSTVESLFPSDEVIEDCAQESFDMEDPNAPICEIDYLGGFVEGAKWLRSRLLAAIDAKDDAKDLQDKK